MSYKNIDNFIDKKRICPHHESRGGQRPLYIVIHYVGAVSTAENNLKYFTRKNIRPASAHLFVDKKIVGLSVPLDRASWSVGDRGRGRLKGKATNRNTINIELCCVKRNNKIIPDPWAIRRARPVVRQLMKQYKIPKYRVIRHFDVTGKSCPNGYLDWYKWMKLRDFLTGVTDIPPWRKQWAKHRTVITKTLAVKRKDGHTIYRLKRGADLYIYGSVGKYGYIDRDCTRRIYLPYTKRRKKRKKS